MVVSEADSARRSTAAVEVSFSFVIVIVLDLWSSCARQAAVPGECTKWFSSS